MVKSAQFSLLNAIKIHLIGLALLKIIMKKSRICTLIAMAVLSFDKESLQNVDTSLVLSFSCVFRFS